eukprot:jgi/Psemu1/11243/gm1.11243_g
MPDTADLDWNTIEDIYFSFGKLPNPANADKHVRLNEAFSQYLYYEETDSLFITHKDGTKTLCLDPVTILHELIIDEIFDCLPSKAKTETTKQHIVALFKFSTMWHIAAKGSLGRCIRNKARLDAAARQAIANHSPVLRLQMHIPHWGFKKDWWPCNLMTVYDINQHQYGKSNTREATTVANKTANSSRARFANLLQGKYTKSKAAPPDTPILVPIKPVKSTTDTNLPVPSPGTGIPPVKTIESAVEPPIQVPANSSIVDTPAPSDSNIDAIVPPPRSPGASSLQPLWSKASHEGRNAICSHSNRTVLRITKRHRDALKIKLNNNQAIYTIFLESEGAQLLPLILDLFNAQVIGGLGVFVGDAASVVRLRIIHGIRRYLGTIMQPSANFGNSFRYIDDVEGQECELVQVNAAMLARPLQSGYTTLHTMRLRGGHTEMLWAHKAFFLPLEFIPLVLSKGLTLAGIPSPPPSHPSTRAWRDLPTPPGHTQISWEMTNHSFRAEAGLYDIMKKNVLLRDLPNLGLAAPLGDAPLTAAVTALTNHQLRLSENLDRRRNKSSQMHTTDEANLSPIYTAWARKSKHKKTHVIFQSQVATSAYNLGIQAPLVTTAILKRFQDCNFYGTYHFDVADGILPLAFTPSGGSAATLKREHEAAANVAAYDTMISTEGNSLSLKDSLELQKTKAYIPADWTEATAQLKSYMAVLTTLLGATHKVQMSLRRAIADEVGERITPAIVVYYFQVRVRGWLEEQWESDTTIPSPDFGEDIHRFRMTQNLKWLPNVSNVLEA